MLAGMRRPHPLAALAGLGALLLGGCGDSTRVDADFTGITLRMVFPGAWGVTELHTTGALEDGSPAFPPGVTPVRAGAGANGLVREQLAIILEAEKDGRLVSLRVEGRDDSGAVLGTADAQARLLLGYFVTTTATLTANVLCGNGTLDEGELCDDGNRLDGDGCSSGCDPQAGFVCVGAPSRCSDTAVTAIVDPTSTDCPGNGTPEAPFCRIERALDAPWATTLALMPGAYDEAVTIDRPVTVEASDGAALDTSDLPALTIEADDVVVRGLTVRGASRIGGGVRVQGSGEVRLEQMTVGPSSTVGVTVEGDVLLYLDRSRITRNAGGGLELGTARGYVVFNSYFTDNGDPLAEFGGVRFGLAPTNSLFANNTIADNEAAVEDAGGVRCDAPARVLNSIVWGSGTVTASVACDFAFSDVGPLADGVTLGAGSFSEDPSFAPGYRLSDNSPCKDRGDPQSIANEEAPDYDHEGEARPQGPNLDVGADEAG